MTNTEVIGISVDKRLQKGIVIGTTQWLNLVLPFLSIESVMPCVKCYMYLTY